MMTRITCVDCSREFWSMFQQTVEDALFNPQQCPDCQPEIEEGDFE